MSGAMDGKRILPLETFIADAKGGADAFLEKYTHPFLLLETKEGDFGEAGFQTLAVGGEPEAKPEEQPDDEPTHTLDSGSTDLDIKLKPRTPVAEKHEEIKKKLDAASRATYVCPLVKRDVNKFASMITLGRAANNDIRVNLPSVSKFHAYFTHVQSNNTWFIADANSSNGTFVNGERLKGDRSRLKLMNGAAIRLGSDVTLRFFEPRSFFEFLKTRLGSL